MGVRSGNVFDYLAWRGDLSFDASGFCAVDGLILSLFSYINYGDYGDFRNKSLATAINALDDVTPEEKMKIICFVQKATAEFLNAAIKAPRFKNIEILDYVSETNDEAEKQFAAVTLLLPDNTVFIAFRGTDDSLTGWKEDFNLPFVNGVPSQIAAANYAQKIYDQYKLPFRMGGHSKGGNLAVWAGAKVSAEAKEKIEEVISYDGPGFLDEFLESEEFKAIDDKVMCIVPDSSIVGILMGHTDYLIIRSSTYLLLQHDPLSWQIIGKHFDYVTERSEAGKKMEEMVNHLLATMDKEEVSDFIDKVFEMLKDTDAKTLDDLKAQKLKLLIEIPKLIDETKGKDPNYKHTILKEIEKFVPKLDIKSKLKDSKKHK